jgi:acyl carrier protein
MTQKQQIINILQEYAFDQLTDFDLDKLIVEMGLDSLDILDFLYRIETEFNLKHKINDDLVNTLTINKIVNILNNK